MSVNWTCPISIPGHVASGLQSLLSNIGAFELTRENIAAVAARNAESKVIMWKSDDGSERVCDRVEDFEPLIGFRWHHGSRG